MSSEHMLDARGAVVWITGLPSSGKSTLGRLLQQRLVDTGRPPCVLDGDEVRQALVPAPSYTPEARDAFYETLARIAALLANQGNTVLVMATAPKATYRDEARHLAPAFVEVYLDAEAQECERRDDKGIYAATRAGRGPSVGGISVHYEPPQNPDVVASGGCDEDALRRIVEILKVIQQSGVES